MLIIQQNQKDLTRVFNKITAQDIRRHRKSPFLQKRHDLFPGTRKPLILTRQERYILMILKAPVHCSICGEVFFVVNWHPHRDDAQYFGSDKFPETQLSDSLVYGFNRAKLSWYTIDPVF